MIVEQGPPAEIFGNAREERTRAFLKRVDESRGRALAIAGEERE